MKTQRKVKGIQEYLVKWKGYQNPNDYTWEPVENLNSVGDLIDQFHSKEGTKKRKKTPVLNKTNEKEKQGQAKKESQDEEVEQSVGKTRGRKKKIKTTPTISDVIKQKFKKKTNTKGQEDLAPKKGQQVQVSRLETHQNEIKEEVSRVNYHLYKNGRLYYDVDLSNADGLIVGTALFDQEEAHKKCADKVLHYVQSYIIEAEALFAQESQTN